MSVLVSFFWLSVCGVSWLEQIFGCIILYRPVLSFVKSWSGDDGRFLQCEFVYCGKSFSVVSLYAPNRNPARHDFFEQVPSLVDPSVPTVVCADFNAVFDRSLDRFGSDTADISRESSVALSHLFELCYCVDIWCYLHPSSSCFTWTSSDGTLASRIDFVGCPYVWVSSVSSCDVIPCPFSDHCAIPFCVSVPDVVPPGPGLWKLNTSILEDEGYVSAVSNFWSGWRNMKGPYPSLAKCWEEGKSHVKALTIRHCCQRSSVSSQRRELLSNLAAHLKSKVDEDFLSIFGVYQSVLGELGALDLDTAKGAQIRARARWVDEGETSSAYFFCLEKKRGADRWISALRDEDGSIVPSPADSCLSFSSLYSSLFTSSPADPVAQQELLSNVSSTLSPGQALECEGSLTLDECHKALIGMAHRKAPGLDGFPMEFYVKFWSILGSDLVDVLNSCYRSGSLSLSQRRGIITLSFNKGDRLDARNWRPISLLNIDYKIAARAIAGRLLKVIHLVVEKDQTCGVPGRYIGENVAFLRDVSYATTFNSPVAILSLDQEKAFDRVDWGFMLSTLRTMGFGGVFC